MVSVDMNRFWYKGNFVRWIWNFLKYLLIVWMCVRVINYSVMSMIVVSTSPGHCFANIEIEHYQQKAMDVFYAINLSESASSWCT